MPDRCWPFTTYFSFIIEIFFLPVWLLVTCPLVSSRQWREYSGRKPLCRQLHFIQESCLALHSSLTSSSGENTHLELSLSPPCLLCCPCGLESHCLWCSSATSLVSASSPMSTLFAPTRSHARCPIRCGTWTPPSALWWLVSCRSEPCSSSYSSSSPPSGRTSTTICLASCSLSSSFSSSPAHRSPSSWSTSSYVERCVEKHKPKYYQLKIYPYHELFICSISAGSFRDWILKFCSIYFFRTITGGGDPSSFREAPLSTCLLTQYSTLWLR